MPMSWPAWRTFVSVLGGAIALGSVATAQTPSSVWTIPGTVNAGGLNGTRFVSDLAVTNPGLAPVTATLTLVPANGTGAVSVTLNLGETVVYRNVLDRLWGAQGAGATQVASDSPLLIRARTYNTAASGTYGVALPVFADDRMLSLGDTADSLWISQSADGSSGYRTNIALVFPDDGGGAATVTVYGADGVEIGSQDFSLDVAGFQQFSLSSFAGAVPVGRAQMRVTSGRAAGYSVVVDNVTGDSSLFTFEDLPAGFQDVLVNGVARANGRNNTFFRTDGRFYNPGSSDATVSVAFHDNKNSNPSPLTKTFTVPAGQILDVVDVLDVLLSLPVGSAGALRFTSDSPVAILCRTSNVDPLGVKPGTFGAQQKPTPLLSFLMSADAGAVVTGIRQNATFRTNIGFAAGEDGADYGLTLKSAAGATVATATGSLGTFGWTQPNVQDLFPNAAIPEDATLLVKVTSGSVDVFDSSIDNASGDPVVTPIMPLPVDIPSTATLGPLGGSIRSSDGRLTLKVPTGALSSPVLLGVDAATNSAPNGRGPAYTLSPGGVSFARPARLVRRNEKSPLESSSPNAAVLAFQSGASWYGVTSSVDPSAGTISAEILGTSPTLLGQGRVTAAETNATWASSYAVDLIAPAAVVVTGGSLGIRVGIVDVKVGHVGTATLLRSPDLSSFDFQWYVGDIFLGNGLIGFIQESGSVATYRAPTCVPASNPVFVRVTWADPSVREGTQYVRTPIAILPRDWSLEYKSDTNRTCAVSGIAYGFGSSEDATFSIGDDLKVTGFQKTGSGLLRTEPTFCGGPGDSGCTITMGAMEKIDIIGLEENSYVNTTDPINPLHLGFILQQQDVPSFTEKCPAGTITTPSVPVLGRFHQFNVPLKGETFDIAGEVYSTEVLHVVPRASSCQ
jgi:hypothetical protein